MALRFTKEEITLHYREDKPTAYKLQLVREQVVKYKQLCKNIAATTGIRKGEIEDVLDALGQQMLQMMEMGHAVQVGTLGTFKPSAVTKCAKSMDELSGDNVMRCKITFYPGEIFRNLLADMEIETESDDDDAPASGGSGSTDSSGEQEDGTDFT